MGGGGGTRARLFAPHQESEGVLSTEKVCVNFQGLHFT